MENNTAAINELTAEQLKAIRINLNSRDYTDAETREAVAEYLRDGGRISDMLQEPETLTGSDAIAYAEQRGLTLSKYNDPTEDARTGLTTEEARKIAAEDPNLIYVEVR